MPLEKEKRVPLAYSQPGSGKITINGKGYEDFITHVTGKVVVNTPFVTTSTSGKFDAYVTVKGGGITGQVEAIRHGFARALVLVDENNRPALKKAGFLTRDSRMVERKKYGKHKARKGTQFSKR